MKKREFDAIIIGSGQAGTPLAFKLAGEGWEVALVEKSRVGGTCVNTGCTPTKAYVASARRIWAANNAAELGINIEGKITADLAKIKARKDEIISDSVNGIEKGIEENDKITLIRGEARFTGHKILEIFGEEIKAEKIFLNVGGRPRIPEEYISAQPLTNISILELTKIPEHLIVAGGGYIGLEFGQMFRRFGSKVTIVEKGDRLIHREDPEVSEQIAEILESEGIHIRLEATCMKAHRRDDGKVAVTVDCATGEPEEIGSHLLLAMGRVHSTDTLDLEKTGLKAEKNGTISVNETLETAVNGIYALGDINGHGGFTHTAYNDYEILADHLFGDVKRKVSDRILTYGLFIDPPLGRVGMTLTQARESGREVLYNDRPMSRVARAKEKGETKGFMRVITDANNGEILGAHILGTGGDEVISGITNLMYAGAGYETLRDSVQIHPTVAELLPTLLEGLKPAGEKEGS